MKHCFLNSEKPSTKPEEIVELGVVRDQYFHFSFSLLVSSSWVDKKKDCPQRQSGILCKETLVCISRNSCQRRRRQARKTGLEKKTWWGGRLLACRHPTNLINTIWQTLLDSLLGYARFKGCSLTLKEEKKNMERRRKKKEKEWRERGIKWEYRRKERR